MYVFLLDYFWNVLIQF